MASTNDLRSRRSAAQLHALAGVEREIGGQDSHSRRKYLREFHHAFRTYEALVSREQVQEAVQAADVVLIGDYHALPASQRYAASLLEQRALAGDRRVVLGVEGIFARDQHIVDEWWRREIDENELRQRVRFDLDWGYEWAPFYELLVSARDHAEAIYGLDCMPREDLRRIGARDRHAAAKIAEMRERHPGAAIFIVFGESHLAPGHLPRALREFLPEARILTLLQNVDSLYWRAAGEKADRIDAVRVREDIWCVFNATPLEKYESYRLCLDQWSGGDQDRDFAPTIYNLIDSLANFLEINRYSPHNSTQPKFLVDLLPEVYADATDETVRSLLSRRGANEREIESALARLEERGSTYLPQANAFCIRDFQMAHAAEDVARFFHQACQGLPRRRTPGAELSAVDAFYVQMIEEMVACFGARVLHPSPAVDEFENDLPLSRAACEKAALAVAGADREKRVSTAQNWGHRIGAALYKAYLTGKVTPRGLRRLFLTHLDEPGLARKVCAAVISKLRSAAKTDGATVGS